MRVLGIETSGRTGSVGAVGEEAETEKPFPHGTSHGRDLAPKTMELLRERGWTFADLDLLAVSAGPGSYTGLRIGMAFAKALSFSTGIPLVGVDSFEAMVLQAPDARAGEIVAPVLDARWGQMYAAAFAREDGGWKRKTPDLVGAPAEVLETLGGPALFFGPGVGAFADTLSRAGRVSPPGPWDRIRATDVARVGRGTFAAQGPSDPDRLHPIYLRPTQAEVRLDGRDPTKPED